MLKAKEPLSRFASSAEVNDTKDLVVPNIYPIKPTLDLDKCEKNPLENPSSKYYSKTENLAKI